MTCVDVCAAGPCELLLTLANLFIVLGLRDALRTASAAQQSMAAPAAAGEAELQVLQQHQQHQQDALTDMQYTQQLHTIHSSTHGMVKPAAAAGDAEQSTSDVAHAIPFPDDISRPHGPDQIVTHAVRVKRVVPAASIARARRVASRCRAVKVAHGGLSAVLVRF